MSDYDAIIIGAGMSGLAAGIRLAHFEKKVCLLEKHSLVGGLNSYYKFQGRRLDVGLHAMTNYVPRGIKSAPLNRLFRQLRIDYDEFALCPQNYSAVAFPEIKLRFSNDPELLQEEIRKYFPGQVDGFSRLVKFVLEFNDLDLSAPHSSARATVRRYITDRLLEDMIFCPLLFYGSAEENDVDFAQFVTMFKGIFREGFARSLGGAKTILDVLVRRFKESGGDLRLRSGVKRLHLGRDRVESVELENGEILRAGMIFSSAGYPETLRLCAGSEAAALRPPTGRLALIESINILDRDPSQAGLDSTIIFFNNSERFAYERPEKAVDVRSGVICCPNNFHYPEPLPEGIVRLTHIANPEPWLAFSEAEYREQKQSWLQASWAEAVKLIPDFRPHIVLTDMFTPRTIVKFTSHIDGAVYGSPVKHRPGVTPWKNLFLCGTDQGFLGIIGAILSGISIANLHGLK
jgi:phytoene dehydrogenase-like protein